MVKHLTRISLSCLLLVYFAVKVNWPVIMDALYRIHIEYYLLSTVIALSGACFMALKYRLLTRRTSLALSVSRLLKIQFISRFYALFLPTALGPEAVRWYKVTRNREGKSFFLAATMYERILFLLMLIGFGLIPLFLLPVPPPIATLRMRLILPALGVGLALSVVLTYLFSTEFKGLVHHLTKKGLHVQPDSRMAVFLDNLALKDRSPWLLACLLLLTLGWQLFFITRVSFLFQALDLPFTFAEAAWMGSLVLFLQVLPVSFAGLGVREGAYAYLFSLYGQSVEKGVLIGVLFFTQMMVFAIIGAILNLFEQ